MPAIFGRIDDQGARRHGHLVTVNSQCYQLCHALLQEGVRQATMPGLRLRISPP